LLCLLVNADRAVSADRLIDALWGDDPPTSASNLLQVYISQLRSAVGSSVIETVAGGYRLHVSDSFFDARAFEALVAEGRQAAAADNPELALSRFRRGLQLWRGEAYADAAAAEFASVEAARLADLRVLCLEERLDVELALGRHEQVLAEARALASSHPLRERPRKQLIVALYRVGRQVEALDEYRELRTILRQELGLEPSAELRALEQAVLRHDEALGAPPAVVAATRRAPPVPPTPLVGRSRELRELHQLVERPDVRLLTIAGAGGSGKTRLAIALADGCLDRFADGVAYVELASVRDPGRVAAAIAESLGLATEGGQSPETAVHDFLTDRELLLVIDNLEHLADAALTVVSLLARAPRVTAVVTSRKVLHVSGEHVYPLQPLTSDAALELFGARAAALARPLDGEADAVRAICESVDCLPLAIELAAARTLTLTPAEILERLRPRLAFLIAGPRDLPARQQTLRATIRWSAELLTAHERTAFARLAVFAGGCSVEAAAAVADATLDDLHSLLEQSLLNPIKGETSTRFTMLETIREYALELLADRGELDETLRRHAEHFAELVSAPEPTGRAQRERLTAIDEDIDNFRAAMDWAEEADDQTLALRLATGLYRHWYVRGLFEEGARRIERPLDRAGDGPLRALALRALAGLLFLLGDFEAAEQRAHEGIDAGTLARTPGAVGACHTVLGLIAKERNEHGAARLHFEQSADIAHEMGDGDGVIVANVNLAALALSIGDLDEARRRWEDTVAINNDRGDPDANGIPFLGLGAVALAQNELADARAAFESALEISRRWDARQNEASALLGLAAVAHANSEMDEAVRLFASAQALFEQTGSALTGSDAMLYDELQRKLGAAPLPR
jgi:predicted ATPase/DNA-binding SARP family transcriptional activator